MEDQQIEKRQFERFAYSSDAEVRTRTETFKCFTMNISAGGILIKTDHPLAVGDKIEVRFQLPDKKKQFRVKAQVVRRAVDTFGIQFNKPIKALLPKKE